jgi:hypothetical protein
MIRIAEFSAISALLCDQVIEGRPRVYARVHPAARIAVPTNPLEPDW